MPNFKTRRTFFAMALSTAALAACGGGGDGDDDVAGGGRAASLEEAYDRIQKGMTYEQVVQIVGSAHNGGESQVVDSVHYTWHVDHMTTKAQILLVVFKGGAAYGKTYSNPAKGINRTQYPM